jgi:hypothetical protein
MQATVTEVTKPRSFGRPAEVKISVEKLFPLGPEEVFLTVGENTKKATEAESAQMAAAGTSVVGAILLGPIGLAGGFLVRGASRKFPRDRWSLPRPPIPSGCRPIPFPLDSRECSRKKSPDPRRRKNRIQSREGQE